MAEASLSVLDVAILKVLPQQSHLVKLINPNGMTNKKKKTQTYILTYLLRLMWVYLRLHITNGIYTNHPTLAGLM
jgi:hypothetical protein